uniref:Putative pyruvate dehydrogenase phosphatase isoenzyme 2 n=1 Tax=Erpetoichthys calabaricus TaxID=27687 RepID=A0A8C4SGT2_ERPCA
AVFALISITHVNAEDNSNTARIYYFNHVLKDYVFRFCTFFFQLRKDQRCSFTQEVFQCQLSPVQINTILRANELSVRIPEFDGRSLSSVLRFESNQLPANSPTEDRRSVATCMQTKGMMFGVFDGHAGFACAQAVSERLLYYIAMALMPQKNLVDIEFAVEHMKPVLPILQWYKHSNDYIYRESASLYIDQLRVFWQELIDSDNAEGLSKKDALSHAFKRLDSDISLEAQIPLNNDLMKNTAIQVALLAPLWSSLPLTNDHNALNEAEVLRVLSEHPMEEKDTVIVENRLLGLLMPFRAFGDVRFKWSKDLQKSILENGFDLESLNIQQYSPPNYHTPPYLKVEPEVTYHRLRPQDKFLILASDGLWDMLSNEEAVMLVAEHLTGIHANEPVSTSEKQVSLGEMHSLLIKRRTRTVPPYDTNVATHLIRHAIGTNEYKEIEQERLAAMVSLPDDLARMYRDDITVTVVYFRKPQSNKNNTFIADI